MWFWAWLWLMKEIFCFSWFLALWMFFYTYFWCLLHLIVLVNFLMMPGKSIWCFAKTCDIWWHIHFQFWYFWTLTIFRLCRFTYTSSLVLSPSPLILLTCRCVEIIRLEPDATLLSVRKWDPPMISLLLWCWEGGGNWHHLYFLLIKFLPITIHQLRHLTE